MMATASIDTFAVTNPAFGAIVLRSFVEGYAEGDEGGLPIPLVILPLPLVLSQEIAVTLGSTNTTTGLLPWVARFPEVTVGLAERLDQTAAISRAALLFGVRYRVLGISESGRVVLDEAGIAKKPKFAASTDTGRALSLARRLGAWAGEIRSPATVLICLGVNR